MGSMSLNSLYRKAAVGLAGLLTAASLNMASPKYANAGFESQGVTYDIMGNGISNFPVSANQGGIPDSTLSTPQFYLFATTGVSFPHIIETTFGGVKAIFSEPSVHIPQARKNVQTNLETLANEGMIFFDGSSVNGITYWSVSDSLRPNVNVALPSMPWTLEPYFSDVTLTAAIAKEAFYVVPGGYEDKLWWDTSKFPLAVAGTNFTPQNQQLLANDAQVFVSLTGLPLPFVYDPERVSPPDSGIWWIFNDSENSTTPIADPVTYEMKSAIIRTTASGWNNEFFRLHEQMRFAYGLRSPNFTHSNFGIANINPTAPTGDDGALCRLSYEWQKRREEGKTLIRFDKVQ
jgi:hypothetical protein